VNCASCHRFGAGGGVPATFNYDQSIDKSRAYDFKPVRSDFGIFTPAFSRLATIPFVIFYRISTEGAGHMPASARASWTKPVSVW